MTFQRFILITIQKHLKLSYLSGNAGVRQIRLNKFFRLSPKLSATMSGYIKKKKSSLLERGWEWNGAGEWGHSWAHSFVREAAYYKGLASHSDVPTNLKENISSQASLTSKDNIQFMP